MIAPQLVVGRGNGTPAMLTVGVGYQDDDVLYEMLGRTDPFAPAGAGGECAFFTLYVTTTHFDLTIALFLTTYIDGVALPIVTRLDLAGVAVPPTKGVTTVHEIGLSKAYAPAGVELLRYAPRGTTIAVQVETKILGGFGTATRQIVDGIEIEYEPVRETMEAVP